MVSGSGDGSVGRIDENDAVDDAPFGGHGAGNFNEVEVELHGGVFGKRFRLLHSVIIPLYSHLPANFFAKLTKSNPHHLESHTFLN